MPVNGDLLARLEKMTSQLVLQLHAFVDSITGLNELVYDNLRSACVLLLQSCQEHRLNSGLLRGIAEDVGKLQEAQLGPHETACVNRLLLILARPARLFECIEFDPEDTAYLASERAVLEAALKHDMPTYIMDRLTVHFGVKTAEQAASDRSQTASPMPMAEFVGLGRVSYEDFKFEPLNAGAYGTVHLAQHVQTGEYVAIKELKKKNVIRKNLMRQVIAERNILQFARNAFIVTCSAHSRPRMLCIW